MRLLILFSVFTSTLILAQSISGVVLDENTLSPIEGCEVIFKDVIAYTDSKGYFKISNLPLGSFILELKARRYKSKKYPLEIEYKTLSMGYLFLQYIEVEQDVVVDLSVFSQNENNQFVNNVINVLQSTRDIYLRRASFDFSQSFFKIRGYNSNRNVVMINGIPMNSIRKNMPIWGYWGGLNDIVKYRDFTSNINSISNHFGGLLATTNLWIQPELFRPGLKVTTSGSNKSYIGRLMATYSSGVLKSGWAYSFSVSRRWAEEGYIQGSVYDANSFFVGVSKQFSLNHTLGFISLYAPQRRGKSSPLTDEVTNLTSHTYNPYWGFQNGKIRNSRVSEIQAPLAMLYYKYKQDKFSLNVSFSMQYIYNSLSRLDYANATNPNPTYYRNLPSYFKEPTDKKVAEILFRKSKQIDWKMFYKVNQDPSRGGRSAYILYANVSDGFEWKSAISNSWQASERFKLSSGIFSRISNVSDYAKIKDFLGGRFYIDENIFGNTRNNLNSNDTKVRIGDKIKYHYNVFNIQSSAFLDALFQGKKVEAFMAINLLNNRFQREGYFRNERYENAFGKGTNFNFYDYGIKSGMKYKWGGLALLSLSALYQTNAPNFNQVYFNSRETNNTIPNIKHEKIIATDINYTFSNDDIKFKISSFATIFKDLTQVHYFYSDSGLGSDFFQEVTQGMDTFHRGLELGLEYQFFEHLSFNAVASLGLYSYINNPSITINFDASDNDFQRINTQGSIDLGQATLKGYNVSAGPQQAYSIGCSYNSDKYWWIAPSLNLMSHNAIGISKFLRTSSFFKNPDDPDGFPFPNISGKKARDLLRQEILQPVYLVSIVGGKTWLIKKMYISLFGVINNLFDVKYKTGGYEQSRAGNYKLLLDDKNKSNSTFGPKYWQGMGRTFFINFSISF